MDITDILPKSWNRRLYNDGVFYRPFTENMIIKKLLEFLPWFISRRFVKLTFREKVVEIPFVFSNLPSRPKKLRILEIGCTGSILSIMLSSLGHDVTGVDLRNYPFSHPNFRFIKGDFNQIKLPKKFFDVVISVSTLEHFGIKHYGQKVEDPDADRKAVKKIHEVLKKDGTLLLTFPFGKRCRTSWYRVYNMEDVNRLLKEFKIIPF